MLPQGVTCDTAIAFPWDVIRKFGLKLPAGTLVTVNLECPTLVTVNLECPASEEPEPAHPWTQSSSALLSPDLPSKMGAGAGHTGQAVGSWGV